MEIEPTANGNIVDIPPSQLRQHDSKYTQHTIDTGPGGGRNEMISDDVHKNVQHAYPYRYLYPPYPPYTFNPYGNPRNPFFDAASSSSSTSIAVDNMERHLDVYKRDAGNRDASYDRGGGEQEREESRSRQSWEVNKDMPTGQRKSGRALQESSVVAVNNEEDTTSYPKHHHQKRTKLHYHQQQHHISNCASSPSSSSSIDRDQSKQVAALVLSHPGSFEGKSGNSNQTASNSKMPYINPSNVAEEASPMLPRPIASVKDSSTPADLLSTETPTTTAPVFRPKGQQQHQHSKQPQRPNTLSSYLSNSITHASTDAPFPSSSTLNPPVPFTLCHLTRPLTHSGSSSKIGYMGIRCEVCLKTLGKMIAHGWGNTCASTRMKGEVFCGECKRSQRHGTGDVQLVQREAKEVVVGRVVAGVEGGRERGKGMVDREYDEETNQSQTKVVRDNVGDYLDKDVNGSDGEGKDGAHDDDGDMNEVTEGVRKKRKVGHTCNDIDHRSVTSEQHEAQQPQQHRQYERIEDEILHVAKGKETLASSEISRNESSQSSSSFAPSSAHASYVEIASNITQPLALFSPLKRKRKMEDDEDGEVGGIKEVKRKEEADRREEEDKEDSHKNTNLNGTATTQAAIKTIVTLPLAAELAQAAPSLLDQTTSDGSLNEIIWFINKVSGAPEPAVAVEQPYPIECSLCKRNKAFGGVIVDEGEPGKAFQKQDGVEGGKDGASKSGNQDEEGGLKMMITGELEPFKLQGGLGGLKHLALR
jgi:hypothetical protein